MVVKMLDASGQMVIRFIDGACESQRLSAVWIRKKLNRSLRLRAAILWPRSRIIKHLIYLPRKVRVLTKDPHGPGEQAAKHATSSLRHKSVLERVVSILRWDALPEPHEHEVSHQAEIQLDTHLHVSFRTRVDGPHQSHVQHTPRVLGEGGRWLHTREEVVAHILGDELPRNLEQSLLKSNLIAREGGSM